MRVALEVRDRVHREQSRDPNEQWHARFIQCVERQRRERRRLAAGCARKSAASLAADRQRAGRLVDVRDTQIAGIALSRHATLATRNERHFTHLNVPVVDPWTA